MRKLLLFALIIILFVSCQQDIKIKELRVAISPDMYPFAYTVGDSLKGLEVELISLIEKRLKVPVIMNKLNYHIILETFYEGEYDLAIGGITIMDRRKDVFDFSLPYYNATQTLVATHGKSILDSLEAISRLRVGVLNSSSSLVFMEDNLIKLQKYKSANLRKYQNQTALVTALHKNEVDFVMLEHTVAELLARQNDLKVVYTHNIAEQYGLVFKKDSSISKLINKALSKTLATDEWHKIESKYLIK